MSAFYLEAVSIVPPPLPDYAGVPVEQIHSSLITNPTRPISPLIITIKLGSNSLRPATHLNLDYVYRGSGSVLIPEPITAEQLIPLGEDVFQIEIPPHHIPRVKVNEGETATAKLVLYAWKNEELLGKFEIGRVEGLGLEGYKSTDLARRRVQEWTKAK